MQICELLEIFKPNHLYEDKIRKTIWRNRNEKSLPHGSVN